MRDTHQIEASSFEAVDRHIRNLEAERGGAWSFFPTFGSVDITRADSPSQIPDSYHDGSRNRIYYKGRWQGFTPAAISREQNRGLGHD